MSAALTNEANEHHEDSPTGRPFAWYGMVFFLASEAVFFANLIAAYLYLRVHAGAWPPALDHLPQKPLDFTLTAVNTLILVSSSVVMHFAVDGLKKGKQGRFNALLLLTIVMGSVFLSLQAFEYLHNGFGPGNGIFGSVFYTLTGFHGLHVTFGVLFMIVVWFRGLRGDFSQSKHFPVTSIEMYWHFVDAVWILLFVLLYVFQ